MNKKVIVIIILIVLIVAVAGAFIYLTKDPCEGYKDGDINIKGECIDKIWGSVCTNFNNLDGSSGTASSAPSVYKIATKRSVNPMTYLQITNDAKEWSKLPDDGHRIGCYGTDRTKWPKNPRLQIADIGYTDNLFSDKPLKRGFYDILGQGLANDYCRYTGGGTNIKFRCQLSNGSNTFAESYNGKTVTEIIGSSLPSV
jgi:hypothetical protein